jgi:4-hydroxybenzoate polyprenyltransferase
MDSTELKKIRISGAPYNRIKGYLEIARVDHWFKNVFMFFGVVLAIFHNPAAISVQTIPDLLLAVLATCLIASSNYVLNEIKDSKFDSVHPKKRFRPIPSGRVNIQIAFAEWIILAIFGLFMAFLINFTFFFTILIFWFMGILYNVAPIRLKDIPYLDVMSESANNPIRLLLGWFAIYPLEFPSISLLLAYWFIGCFFMSSKRFSEYRFINSAQVAAQYRKSFNFYSEKRLLVSMFFYTTLFGLFFGIFILRYHFELILMTPFVACFIGYYVNISLDKDSAVQNPEKLYRDKPLIVLSTICLLAFLILLFTNIPIMYDLFKVSQPQINPLWIL